MTEQERQLEQPTIPKKKKHAKQELAEWIETIVSSVVVVVLLFTFCFRMVGISGGSMMQTLHDGERVILFSVGYQPKQGDIVVVSRDYMQSDKEPIIKRIIATEGQEVRLDCENNKVYVDGVALDEPYVFNERDPLVKEQIAVENPHVVKEGHVFVLGDHRDNSLDSRAIGDVDERYILGRAVLRVYPLNQLAVLK